jgi:hypothetical protein
MGRDEATTRTEIPPGTLYMLPKRGRSDNNRRARYYHLTPVGKRQLSVKLSEFERVLAAIVRVIQPA